MSLTLSTKPGRKRYSLSFVRGSGSAPIDQFRDQLKSTVEIIRAILRATGHYRVAGEAFRQLRRSTQQAKTALRAMEESSTAPEMANFIGLLKLDEVSNALVAVNELEQTLRRLPAAFSGRQKPRKGPAPRVWYSGFFATLLKSRRDSALK